MLENVENAEGDIAPGTIVLGRYQIIGKLAQGGMAEVYLARQLGAAGYEKLVVTKRVRPHLTGDEDFVGMFVNEARLAAMINHPNVVHIFDLGEEPAADPSADSDWFLAMEYLDGRDMLQVGRACRSHNKAVPFDVTARIIADACAGLEHAHNLRGKDGNLLNLVHRDMSPENLIITFDGQVKVVDFGIAKAADNSVRTQDGQIKGKLGYVAPEAILGKPLDGRADIFAVGATLYLFLSGRPAFSGATPMEIFERSLKRPPSPQELNPRVPPALDEICMRALQQDRDKRYRTAGEVRAALEAYLQSTGRQLGAPQLAQFMRILFPPGTDPVAQRIEALLAAAPPVPALSPRTGGTQAPAPMFVQTALDEDRTQVGAPAAVEIGSGVLAAAARQPQWVGPVTVPAAHTEASHLRSVSLSDQNTGLLTRSKQQESVDDDGATQIATIQTAENVDIVRTMDIEALPMDVRSIFEDPTVGGIEVDRLSSVSLTDGELDDLLANDALPSLMADVSAPLSPAPLSPAPAASPPSRASLPPPLPAAPGPQTGPAPAPAAAIAGPAPTYVPPPFYPSSVEPFPRGISGHSAASSSGGASFALRLTMALLGVLTGTLVLLIALAITGNLSIIID